MHLCSGWIGFYVSWQSTWWNHETTILIMTLGKWIYQLFAHIQAKATCWFNVLPLFFKIMWNNTNNVYQQSLFLCFKIMSLGPPAAFDLAVKCHYTVASPVAGSYSKLYPDSTGTARTSSLCYDRYVIYQNAAVVQLAQFSWSGEKFFQQG